MDNVEVGDEDVRKNLGAIPSAKAVNPHQQQQQHKQYGIKQYVLYPLPAFLASATGAKCAVLYPPGRLC